MVELIVEFFFLLFQLALYGSVEETNSPLLTWLSRLSLTALLVSIISGVAAFRVATWGQTVLLLVLAVFAALIFFFVGAGVGLAMQFGKDRRNTRESK